MKRLTLSLHLQGLLDYLDYRLNLVDDGPVCQLTLEPFTDSLRLSAHNSFLRFSLLGQ